MEEWSNSSEHNRNYENMHHPRILKVLKQSRWLVFAIRVTFNEHNLSIIGIFVEHNRKIIGAVQNSIIGYFLSIIGSALGQLECQVIGQSIPTKELFMAVKTS